MKHFNIAIAIIWREGKVLCAHRLDDADHVPGFWEFPGGKCAPDETLEECVRREVREEIGIEVLCTGTRKAITHNYPERTVTLHPFDCEIIAGEPQALGNAEIRWLHPHELRAADFPAANAQLIEHLRTTKVP